MKRIKIKELIAYKDKCSVLLRIIHLKCAESNNYFRDGYIKSTELNDPLYPYYPNLQQYKSLIRTKEFRRRKHEAFP